jgi:hypothetical protein
MKHASSRQVFEYWNQRRGDRVAPDRADIEPGPIRRALGDTFILGEDAQGAYRFRLSGTRSCALFCRELKDADFLTLWDEAERPKMLQHVTAAVEDSAGFVAGAVGRTGAGATVDLELLVLPLRHRKQTRSRVLGVLAPLEPPFWLGLTPIEAISCGGIRYLGPDSRRIVAPRLVPGGDNADRYRGLTIYDGGRS